jgi:hypothetical protein
MELTALKATGLGLALSLSTLPLAAGSSLSQEAKPGISMELNGLAAAEGGCRLTFVVANGLSADITKAVYEVALFDQAGQVERLMTLDFQSLPAGRTRVRQFDIADLGCGTIARVLINDATECGGVEPAACMRDLETRTATDIGFGS